MTLFPFKNISKIAPEISVRIGLAYGYALVVLYENSLEKAYIDIVGSSISLANRYSSRLSTIFCYTNIPVCIVSVLYSSNHVQ